MHSICFSLFLFLFQTAADPPVLTLTSIEPAAVMNGTTVAITFRGTGFVAGQSRPEISAVAAGNAIPFGSAGAAQWSDENTMTFAIRVQVPPGIYYANIVTSTFGGEKRSNSLQLTVLSGSIPSPTPYDVMTFAGKPGGPGAANGKGQAARFAGVGHLWGDGSFLYIPDNHSIRRLELSTGLVTTIAGLPYLANYFDGNGSGARFNTPNAVWGDGINLYVSDAGNRSIRKMVLSTREVSTVGLRGMLFANDLRGTGSTLYFTRERTIYGLNPDTGASVFGYGLEPFDDQHYGFRSMPLWVEGRSIYVIDNGSNDPQRPRSVLRKIDIDTGAVTTIAGSASATGYVDGAGSLVRFNYPLSMWGHGRYLFIADTGESHHSQSGYRHRRSFDARRISGVFAVSRRKSGNRGWPRAIGAIYAADWYLG